MEEVKVLMREKLQNSSDIFFSPICAGNLALNLNGAMTPLRDLGISANIVQTPLFILKSNVEWRISVASLANESNATRPQVLCASVQNFTRFISEIAAAVVGYGDQIDAVGRRIFFSTRKQ